MQETVGVQQGVGGTVNMLETVDNCWTVMWSAIERDHVLINIIECYGIHDAGFLAAQ